jgi:hypothetical protein
MLGTMRKKKVVAYLKLGSDSLFPLEGLRQTTNVSRYKFHGRVSEKQDNYGRSHNKTMSTGAADCDRNIHNVGTVTLKRVAYAVCQV